MEKPEFKPRHSPSHWVSLGMSLLSQSLGLLRIKWMLSENPPKALTGGRVESTQPSLSGTIMVKARGQNNGFPFFVTAHLHNSPGGESSGV